MFYLVKWLGYAFQTGIYDAPAPYLPLFVTDIWVLGELHYPIILGLFRKYVVDDIILAIEQTQTMVGERGCSHDSMRYDRRRCKFVKVA